MVVYIGVMVEGHGDETRLVKKERLALFLTAQDSTESNSPPGPKSRISLKPRNPAEVLCRGKVLVKI